MIPHLSLPSLNESIDSYYKPVVESALSAAYSKCTSAQYLLHELESGNLTAGELDSLLETDFPITLLAKLEHRVSERRGRTFQIGEKQLNYRSLNRRLKHGSPKLERNAELLAGFVEHTDLFHEAELNSFLKGGYKKLDSAYDFVANKLKMLADYRIESKNAINFDFSFDDQSGFNIQSWDCTIVDISDLCAYSGFFTKQIIHRTLEILSAYYRCFLTVTDYLGKHSMHRCYALEQYEEIRTQLGSTLPIEELARQFAKDQSLRAGCDYFDDRANDLQILTESFRFTEFERGLDSIDWMAMPEHFFDNLDMSVLDTIKLIDGFAVEIEWERSAIAICKDALSLIREQGAAIKQRCDSGEILDESEPLSVSAWIKIDKCGAAENALSEAIDWMANAGYSLCEHRQLQTGQNPFADIVHRLQDIGSCALTLRALHELNSQIAAHKSIGDE